MGALFAGIRVRLFGMILPAVLPLVAVSGFELKQERQRNIEAAHANAVEIARRSADLYDRSILEARILLEAVADFGNFACDHAAAMLRWAGFARCEAGRALWVIGPDGSVVCANSRGGIGLNIADRRLRGLTGSSVDAALMLARSGCCRPRPSTAPRCRQ